MNISLSNRVYTSELIKLGSKAEEFFEIIKALNDLIYIDEVMYDINDSNVIVKQYYLAHVDNFYRQGSSIKPLKSDSDNRYLYDIYIGKFKNYIFISAPFKKVAEIIFKSIDFLLESSTGSKATLNWQYTKINPDSFLFCVGESAKLMLSGTDTSFNLVYCHIEYIFNHTIRSLKQNIQLQCKQLDQSPQYRSLVKEFIAINSELNDKNTAGISELSHNVESIKLLSFKFRCSTSSFPYITCYTDKYGNFRFRLGKNIQGYINLVACLVNLCELTDIEDYAVSLPFNALIGKASTEEI